MQIKKIFNNNVVLFEINNKEVVVMGKGIAFGKRNGNFLEKEKIEKVFQLQNSNNTERFKELLKDVPMSLVSLSSDIIEYAKNILDTDFNEYIYITLTDHLNFAINRAKENISYVNALKWDIKKYYPKEYGVGMKALNLIKEELDVDFTEDEAVNIALHFINASDKIQLNETIQVIKMTEDILNIIKYSYNQSLDEETLSYERFMTHLKFFFQRLMKNVQVVGEDDFIFNEVKNKYSKAYECTKRVEKYLLENFKRELTKEEKAYLTIHIQRITQN